MEAIDKCSCNPQIFTRDALVCAERVLNLYQYLARCTAKNGFALLFCIPAIGFI